MRWQDIDFDTAVWTIPAGMNKSGRTHHVPLATQVVDLLRSLPRLAVSAWVFTTSGDTPISSYGQAKARLDATVRELHGSPLKHWSYHDLRRGTATGMAELGTPPHVVSEVLNHARKTITGQVYDRYGYLPEKRMALQAWADHVALLTSPSATGTVVTLRA
jgi:integrase